MRGESLRRLNAGAETIDREEIDEENVTEGLLIEVVDNGWIARATNVEGEVYTQVYQIQQGKEMMRAIAEALGINA